MSTSQREEQRRIGRELIRRGIVDQEGLQEALALLRQSSGDMSLLELLAQLGHVERGDLPALRAEFETAPPTPPKPPTPPPAVSKVDPLRPTTSRRPVRKVSDDSTSSTRRLAGQSSRRQRAAGQTKRVKPEISRKGRLIQMAFYFSPVVIFLLILGYRLFGMEKPIEVDESDPGEAAAPIEPAGTDRPPVDPPADAASRLSRAEDRFDAAFRDFKNPDLSAAEAFHAMAGVRTLLDDVLEDDPAAADARLLRSRVRSLLDDPSGAIEDLDAIVAVRPDDPLVRLARARERIRLHFREMALMGAWWQDPRIWPHRRLLDTAGEDLRVVGQRGNAGLKIQAEAYLAFVDRNPQRAFQALETMASPSFEMQAFKGLLLYWSAWAVPRGDVDRAKMVQLARNELDRALDLRAHDTDIRLNLALCRLDVNQTEMGVETVRELGEARPDDPLVQFFVGRVYMMAAAGISHSDPARSADLDRRARTSFDRSIATAPDLASDAYVHRAELFAYEKDYQAAITDLDSAMRIYDKNVRGLSLRAAILHAQNKLQEAYSAAGKALELRADLWDLYRIRADALQGAGETQAARQEIERALSLGPPEGVRAQFERLLGRR